jgi:3-hydroxypropanoate dehydrogenase
MRDAIQAIFRERTCYDFSSKPVSDSLLEEIYDVAKFGASSANSSPLRIIFVKSSEAKQKLLECFHGGNKDKTEQAPVVAIFAYDLEFYTYMDILFPHNPGIQNMFKTDPIIAQDTAYRNSTLQAAYFMVVARAYGLDLGPMSGFDDAKLNKAFFDGQSLRVNFLCNLGYRNKDNPFPRDKKLEFSQACKFI